MPEKRQQIGYIALLVREYDEAIAFYRDKLGFTLIEDTPVGGEKRWVLMRPPGGAGTCLLLARGVGTEQVSRIGNQTGGRVFLFLHTDDFWRDYHAYTAKGVAFRRPLAEEA